MTSCRNCSECTSYIPGGDTCAYCDCSFSDHQVSVEFNTPQTSTFQPSPIIPNFSQPSQQMQPNTNMYNTPTYMPSQNMNPPMPYSDSNMNNMQMDPISQQMYQPPQQQYAPGYIQPETQFYPNYTNYFPSPQFPNFNNPYPQPFPGYSPQMQNTGQPLHPPQNPSPMSNFSLNSCQECGIIGIYNNGLCEKCYLIATNKLCSKCKINAPNPNHKWCQACFEGKAMCNNCGVNPPNEGYKWCQACFENSSKLDGVNQVLPSPTTPMTGDMKCYGCNRARYTEPSSGKLMDFCSVSCSDNIYTKKGAIKLRPEHEEYKSVAKAFTNQWSPNKGKCPPVTAIFRTYSKRVQKDFDLYLKPLQINTTENSFHGSTLVCDLLNDMHLCKLSNCAICQVSWNGFDEQFVALKINFTRFGKGIYFAPNSSKCHDYTVANPNYGYRCIMYVEIAPGKKQIETRDKPTITGPNPGFNSVYGKAAQGGSLNYDEICIYNAKACKPKYLIIYYLNGTHKIAT